MVKNMKPDGFIRKLQNNFGDNVLTLSGNILITAPLHNAAAALDNSKIKPIKEAVKRIRQGYEFLEVDLVYGLTDIEIKFFANKKRLNSKEFLEEFNEKLLLLVQDILAQDAYSVRLNIFGKYCAEGKALTFRYLNKEDDVRYIVVDEEKCLLVDKIFTPKVVTALLVLAAAGYAGYVLYGKYFNK